MLRRDGFAAAEEATVVVRVIDKAGITPANLQSADFMLIVNGKPRDARLHAPGVGSTAVPPVVLLVFPPNDPTVHHIGVTQAAKYFSQQPAELLPWKVGIFDSNGKLTPFTDGRSQLLANLDVVEHTTEPFQYSTDAGVWADFRWNGSWLSKAEEAISVMQRYEGAKVILAMNPLAESIYGLNDQILAHDGPESLTEAAKHIGGHIYIANVGGPEVLVPGGEAAQDHPAQINQGAGPPLMGTAPSYHMQIDPNQTAALNYFAYRNSQMMQTAATTLGGFANSLNDLAGQIHHNLDGNYSLDFDMTPEDRDRGVPSVEVRLTRHDLRVALLDVVPIGVAGDADRAAASKKLAEMVTKAAKEHVSSPDFRITQHVDYFPLHEGLEPVLPMSCVVEWIGPEQAPAKLSIVESVEDVNLSTMVLQRELQARWDGRSLSWERDGQLRPGRYIWRIALHDGKGKILSTAEENVDVSFPHPAPVAVSSLILGKACEEGELKSGLRHRPPANSSGDEEVHPLTDPMHAADCRLKPESAGRFASTDTLHAFVRIYPEDKLDKHKPESWTATFVLRSQSGSVEVTKEMPFAVDSGSGYLASIEMPLSASGISPGPHTLDVQMRGPGIHKDLRESRQISILAGINP